MSPKGFIGENLPGWRPEELGGKLIVIEGADGSGRSVQIELLKNWLEEDGHGVVNVGLKQSSLVSEELEQAKQGNILGPITLSLFYATDFADQLENKIIPALRAGFIVLADRYVYTLMARDIVRGADPAWLEAIYEIAIRPDIVFYLKVSPQVLVDRNFQKNATLDYWESGMDIPLSRDMFQSFMRYQAMIQKQFKLFQRKYGFEVVNGNRTPKAIAREIRAKCQKILPE
ncbi:MAG TPA: thymidylate kinase [Candidatus Brocadiia bacterium]|nr:thymidylate kinase [Candidatus Brocadiia bacterium]